MASITIHNVHTHIFTLSHIPSRFMVPGLVGTFKNKRFAKVAAWGLKRIVPFSKSDKAERLTVFAEAARNPEQGDILKDLMGFYPPETRFGLLSMDLDHMNAGKADKDFLVQLKELIPLKEEYGDLITPFIAIDPRHEGLLELVKEYIEEHNFGGLKLYPPLGYYPFDERLFGVYEYAEKRQIPIIAHCSPGGVHWQGRVKAEWRKHPKTGEMLKGRSISKFSDYFTHPANYYWVLDQFPKLKLCFAHFGGAEEWAKFLQNSWPREKAEEGEKEMAERCVCNSDVSWLSIITDMIRNKNYPNIYADISYTAYKTDYLPLIKVMVNNDKLRKFILYGSDCYMVQMDISERAFSLNVRGMLGEEDYHQIAETNPRKFLRIRKA